jgi:glycosyltransferase involved in cell wall biosynthesis
MRRGRRRGRVTLVSSAACPTSIFAAPARYEPFGLAALEAGLAGCALVLGDIPTLREVWDDAAVYVDPGDAAGLANEIQALIADSRRRETFGRAAARRAATFTPARMAAGYLDAYERLRTRALDEPEPVEVAS